MPRSVKAENNLGLAYEGLYRPEQAMQAYRQAIEWQKSDPHPSEQPLLNLGNLLLASGHPEEAIPYLRQAEELSPGDVKIHIAMGKLYQKQEAWEKAALEFQRAISITPKDAALHFQLGQIYRREGLSDQAKAEFALVTQLNGDHATTP